MKKYGLTGGVGCGKSVFGRMLEALGWRLIDADLIAHDLYRPGQPGHEKIIDAFGKKVLNNDQTVNRALLGQLVFEDSEKLRLLNSLVHPLIRKVWQQQHEEHLLKRPEIPVLAIIPLLFEAGIEEWFDSIVCVGCSAKTQRKRLLAQGRDARQLERRIEAQWPLHKKMEKSQWVVWNNGSLEHLEAQAFALNMLWTGNLH